jgi:hypothetical protein
METTELLQRVRVASPCNADWNAMEGDERARFCRLCSKHVYNFSAMLPEEIAGLIQAREGRLCARFYRRRDGTMLTANCPVGRRRQWRRDLLGLFFGAVGLLATALGIAAASQNAGSCAAGRDLWQTLHYKLRTLFQPVPTRCGTPGMGKLAVLGDIAIAPPSPPPSSSPESETPVE